MTKNINVSLVGLIDSILPAASGVLSSSRRYDTEKYLCSILGIGVPTQITGIRRDTSVGVGMTSHSLRYEH